jgi:hypothetical protein
MGDRAAKLRKLNAFRRKLPHCSASALGAILKEIKQHGVPEGATSRDAFRDARDLQNHTATPFGAIVQTLAVSDKDDVDQQLTIAHPIALLWVASKECLSFSAFFLEKLKDNPPSLENPWHIVLYTDEVTPGNPLATMNNRKFHAIYWSFMEFGVNALSREEAWFTVATEYSVHVSKLSAGLSQVVAKILKCFFSDGVNLAVTGALMEFADGTTVRIWAVLGGALQDGGAHKSVWHCRGDAGSKFCLICKNLFAEKSELVDDDGTNLLCCNVLTYAELVPATSKELRKNYRYLEKLKNRGLLNNDEFDAASQALGLTYHKHALLLEKSLDAFCDPVEIYMHDWMHAIFVDGIFNVTLYLLLETMITLGFPDVYQNFSDYISNWSWPNRLMSGAHLAGIFDDSRKEKHRKAKHIKCQASDGLSLVVVTAAFVQKVLMKLTLACTIECKAFLALVHVIELIVAAARATVAPEKLLAAVEHFLKLFRDAWGIHWMTPKFHWLLHLWKLMQKFRRLLNCFCLERKHRQPKRYASDLANISSGSSKSLLMEVTSHFLGQITHPDAFAFGVGLVDGHSASKKTKQILIDDLEMDPNEDAVDSIKVSTTCRFSPLATCHKGDVVLFRDGLGGFKAGQIQLHCEVQGVPISLISPYVIHKLEADCSHSVWTPLDNNSFVESDQILDTVVYSARPDGKVAILLPLEFR